MADRAHVENAADPEQVTRAGRRQKRSGERRLAQVQKQLSTYDGRAFVWAELERHHLFAPIVADAPQIFVLAGVHNEGLRLFAECQQCPALYLEMQREAVARAEREQRETEAGHLKSVEERRDD